MSGIIDKAKDALNLNKNDVTINGQKIHGTGYGLMGLTWRAEPPSQEQSFEAMSMSFSFFLIYIHVTNK
jgi:pyridoxine 4-dehydrogenase